MDNVMGTQNMQAPPPPPLPEGMREVGRSAPPPPPLPEGMHAAGKSAPPPPPLPAGMHAAGKSAPPPPPLPAGMHAAGKSAPPPPPLPAGMHAAGKSAPPPPPLPAGMHAAGKSAPPPPPLPEGMRAAGMHTDNMSDAHLTQGAGRSSMSLADAVMEKEQEEAIARMEQLAPKLYVNGGELGTGNMCFARSPMDGLYYIAVIADAGANAAMVNFYDGVAAQIPSDRIYTVSEAVKVMQCFANYSQRGNYYPAVIESGSGEHVTVRYDEDPAITETLELSGIRFAPR